MLNILRTSPCRYYRNERVNINPWKWIDAFRPIRIKTSIDPTPATSSHQRPCNTAASGTFRRDVYAMRRENNSHEFEYSCATAACLCVCRTWDAKQVLADGLWLVWGSKRLLKRLISGSVWHFNGISRGQRESVCMWEREDVRWSVFAVLCILMVTRVFKAQPPCSMLLIQ